MSLAVCGRNDLFLGKKSQYDYTKTYLGQGNGFTVKIYKNKYYDVNKDKWLACTDNFYGISSKEISLNFSTSWDSTGGAKLANKIRDNLLSNKILRGLASQNTTGNTGGIDPFVLSDAWTQKKMTGSQPLNINVSFRSFYEDTINATSYTKIIPMLMQLCSPPGGLLLLGDAASKLIKSAGQGAIDTLSNVTDAAKNIGNAMTKETTDENSANEKMGAVISSINNVVKGVSDFIDKQTLDTAGTGINNGNFTVLLSLGDIIHERSLSNADSVHTSQTKIDWIVKSFNSKPSIQFMMVNKLPMPLWFDIDITLETRLTLSNKFIYNILNGTEINVSP